MAAADEVYGLLTDEFQAEPKYKIKFKGIFVRLKM
jgi:hypothetical protein